MSLEKNKLQWADNIRAIATVSVILLHVAAPILYKFGKISDYYWWIGNIIDSTVRFCVPMFLMLSGALMLSKEYELGDFIKKRFTRILYPFLFWSAIYVIINLINKYSKTKPFQLEEVLNYILLMYKKKPSYHLWFVYVILGIYLFMPVIGKWIRNSTEKEQRYFLIIWFITTIISFPSISKYTPEIDLRYFSGYLGFVVLGYYLTANNFNNNFLKYAWVFFISGVLITIFGTYYMTMQWGKFYGGFYAYLKPNIVLASAGIFFILKNVSITNNLQLQVIGFISKYSFGIYLAHVLILIFFSEIGIDWLFVHPYIGIPLTTASCLVISCLLVFIINKIPVIGKHVSG